MARRRAFGEIERNARREIVGVRYRNQGRRVYETVPKPLRDATQGEKAKWAEQTLARRCLEVENGSALLPNRATVGEWLAEWLASYPQGNTRRVYAQHVDRLTRLVGTVRLQRLTVEHIEKAAEALRAGLTAKVVNETLNAGRAAWNVALRRKLVRENPWTEVKRLPLAPSTRRSLTPDEARSLLEHLLRGGDGDVLRDEPANLMLAVLLLEIRRYNELAGLRWVDINWGGNEWRSCDSMALTTATSRTNGTKETTRTAGIAGTAGASAGSLGASTMTATTRYGTSTAKQSDAQTVGAADSPGTARSGSYAINQTWLAEQGTLAPTSPDDPKHPRKTYTMNEMVAGILRRQQLAQNTARTQAETEQYIWREQGLVFTGRCGDPMPRTTLQHALDRATKALGLDHLGVHELRHTGVSLMITNGADQWQIAAAGGWKDLSMIQKTYGHLFAARTQEAKDGLAALLMPRRVG